MHVENYFVPLCPQEGTEWLLGLPLGVFPCCAHLLSQSHYMGALRLWAKGWKGGKASGVVLWATTVARGGEVGPEKPPPTLLLTAQLEVLIPETQLPLGHIEVEAVALLAAADTALVGRWPLAAVAVLEHAGVPGQA